MQITKIVKLNQILDDIFARTPSDLVITGNYIIVGAGGVGTWVSIALAISAKPYEFQMVVIDNDELEIHNLNRLPYPIQWAIKRRKKVLALRDFILAIRPYIDIIAVEDVIDSESKVEYYVKTFSPTMIVDCVDNLRSIILLKKACSKYGIPYIGAHYDGTSLTIEYDPRPRIDDWAIDDNARGYQVFPSVSFVPMMIGSLVTALIALRPNERVLIQFDLRNEFNPS